MGSPEFAVPTLLEISNSGRVPIAVYTRAPARSGRRGLRNEKNSCSLGGGSLGVPVFTPSSLRDVEVQKAFNTLAADVVLVAAYGLILPTPILTAPRLGCLNFHASLLPRWRGAAPIQRAIMAGDLRTGIDVMRMDAGLDTGPIAMREVVPVRPDETAGDLTSRLAALAAKMALHALQSMEASLLTFHEQSALALLTHARLRRMRRRLIGRRAQKPFATTSMRYHPRQVPFRKSSSEIRKKILSFFALRSTTGAAAPGMLLSEDMRIACGTGAIRVLQGQRSGKTVMSGRELMRGATIAPGAIFTQSRWPWFQHHLLFATASCRAPTNVAPEKSI